jgi:1-acyl-sn-glycerol-3-phosphate acyltransferase
LITTYHSIPIKRGSADRDAFSKALELLKDGGALLMFPEGTRTLDGELQPPKRGVGYIAVKAQVPIVPVYISGSFDALPKGRKFPRPARIQVYFGEVLSMDKYKGREQEKALFQEISQDVMNEIARLKEQNKPVKK